MMKSQKTIGIIEIILSALCFGTLGIMGKAAFKMGLAPGELLAFRFLMASAILWIYLFIFKRQSLVFEKEHVLNCAFLGTIGYAIFATFSFLALTRLSASLTVLLLYLYPAMVTLGERVFFHHRLDAKKIAAVIFSFFGLVLLVLGDLSVSSWTGILFGVGSAVFYALYILISGHRLSNKMPLLSATMIQGFAGITLAVIHLHSWPRITEIFLLSWPLLLLIAVVGTVLPMAFFLSGLQKLKSSEASILSTIEPLSSITLAAIFLHERLGLWQYVGGGIVLLALILISRQAKSARGVACAKLATPL